MTNTSYTPNFQRDLSGFNSTNYNFNDVLDAGYSLEDANRLTGGGVNNIGSGADYIKYAGGLDRAAKLLGINAPTRTGTAQAITEEQLKGMGYNQNQIYTMLGNGKVDTNRAYSWDANGNPVYENSNSNSNSNNQQSGAQQTQTYTLNGKTYTTPPGGSIPVGGSKVSDSTGNYTPPAQSTPAPAPGTQGTAPLAPNSQTGGVTPQGTPVTTTPQGTAPQAQPSLIESGNLMVGSKSDSVKALQTALNIKSDGIFGQQTQAAVKAFQQAHGLKVDGIVGPETAKALGMAGNSASDVTTVTSGMNSNSTSGTNNTQNGSATSDLPSTGNSTIDALLSRLSAVSASPQTTFAEVYKQVYTDMGVTDMKASYDAQTKQYADLQNEKNDKASEINANPWYSEGERVNLLKNLDAKYEGKEKILTDKLKLLETNITNAKSDAQFVAGKMYDSAKTDQKLQQDEIIKAIDIAEKAAEAERSQNAHSPIYKEWQDYQSAGGKLGFNDYQTMDANRKAVKSTTNNITTAESQRGGYTTINQLLTLKDKNGVPYTDGKYFTVQGFKTLVTEAPTEGISRADFIAQYADKISPYAYKNYGLTPAEITKLGFK